LEFKSEFSFASIPHRNRSRESVKAMVMIVQMSVLQRYEQTCFQLPHKTALDLAEANLASPTFTELFLELIK
jgi:hypothetical protein